MTHAGSRPPRRPRRPGKWTWLLTGGLILCLYAGAYARLRARDTFMVFLSRETRYEVASRLDVGPLPWLFFAPCIAVEEWWLNW